MESQIKYSWKKSSISKIIWMVKVQGIAEQNKNAYHRAKKMKPKDYSPETCVYVCVCVCVCVCVYGLAICC